MITKLIEFVENGGRFHSNEEPKFGEPFYGDYMKQFVKLHYKPGDRVKLQKKGYDNDIITYEGIIIALDYILELLISGKRVHKDKRNKKSIPYYFIKSIEMISSDDGTFDLSIVDPDEWSLQNNSNKTVHDTNKETDYSKKKRIEEKNEFNMVYQDKDFNMSHIINVIDGCSLYWPFEYDEIAAEVFMVRDNIKVTPIPCKTGTPFPNKNYFHTYNYMNKNKHPELFLFLPDNGFRYKDVNVVCLWKIKTTISGKNKIFNVVNIHHVGEVKPIKNGYNQIFIEMHTAPLLGYGESLFTDPHDSSLLSSMMNKDMYCILNMNEDIAHPIKLPEDQTKEETEKYLYMASMAVNNFNPLASQRLIANVQDELDPIVELFCTIDKEPVRYYSGAWRYPREGYKFHILQ